MDYGKLAKVGVQKVSDSTKFTREQVLDALRKRRAAQKSKIQDSIEDKFKDLGFKVISKERDGDDTIVTVNNDEDILDVTMGDEDIHDWLKENTGLNAWFDGGDKEDELRFRISYECISDSRKPRVTKDFKKFKVTDGYKNLKKKIKDELDETETTEEAVEVAVDQITPDTPAEQVVAAVTEILADTIDTLQAQVEEAPEETEELTDEEIDEYTEGIEDSAKRDALKAKLKNLRKVK